MVILVGTKPHPSLFRNSVIEFINFNAINSSNFTFHCMQAKLADLDELDTSNSLMDVDYWFLPHAHTKFLSCCCQEESAQSKGVRGRTELVPR